MPFTDNLQERRNALQRAYIRSLPDKARELRHCWQTCRQQSWPPDSVQQLFILVHRLTGSGTTFGLPQLSESAASAENYLQLAQARGQIAPDQRIAVEHTLETLCRLLVELAEPSIPDTQGGLNRINAISTSLALPGGRQLPLIYLAEDDKIQAEALAQKLVTYGYRMRTFADIQSLDQAVRTRRPDAILMDIVFPGDPSAGLHAAQQLGPLNNPPIPTLFISQRSDIRTRLDALHSGAVAYLTKPVNPLQLINRLEELLSQQPPAAPRVLIVDDDRDLSQWYQTLFATAGINTAVINDPLAVMPSLVEFHPELLVLDLHMPGASGLDITRALRQEEAYSRLPIMIISHDASQEKQLQCLDAGADDYLLKPVDGDFLTRLVCLRIDRQRRLQQAISRDPLTGLLNRNAFLEHFETLLGITIRTRGKLSVALLDLDDFQRVNEQHGHINGDIILKTVARQLATAVRRTDILGRFGGDEFALVLPDTDPAAVRRLLEQLNQRLSNIVQDVSGAPPRLSLSIGLVSCDYQIQLSATVDTDQLLASADQALWIARCAGGNCIRVAGEPESATPESRGE